MIVARQNSKCIDDSKKNHHVMECEQLVVENTTERYKMTMAVILR